MFNTLTKTARLPEAQTKLSAGYDVYSDEHLVIPPNCTEFISLGIALSDKWDDKQEYFLGLYLRSSLGKKGLSIPQSVGIIDADYRDEIKLVVHNDTDKRFTIKQYDRVGQLIIHKHYGIELFGQNYRINESRIGGFGSTDNELDTSDKALNEIKEEMKAEKIQKKITRNSHENN